MPLERRCRWCGRLQGETELSPVATLCLECLQTTSVCSNCGERVSTDELYSDLCEDCYTRSRILEYHSGSPHGQIFYPYEGEELYFGVELETDGYGDLLEAAADVLRLSLNKRLFWLETDRSLISGFELITQPATLEYHRSKFPWAKITECLKQHGAKAEDSERAAMHVHFSSQFFPPRHYSSCALKAVYLFDKFRKELLATAKTTTYLANRSAQPYYKAKWAAG